MHKYNRWLKDDWISAITLFPSLHYYKWFMFVCARADYNHPFPVKCLSHQMFSDCSSVSVLPLIAALPVPERHGDVLTAAGHRVGGECGINITVGSQCNNQHRDFFFFLFFQYPEDSWLLPLILSQLGFVRHAKCRGHSSHPDRLLSDTLPGQQINRLCSCRMTAPISLLINAATQNEPCSVSHRDICEFYSVLTQLWHQLTKICVSWVSCFA